MADYPNITLLSELDSTTPAGTEDSAKLDDALRQTKNFLETFLAIAHDDDGSIKDGTVGQATISQGAIRGTDDNAGLAADENEIAQGTVATPDIKDEAVTAAKLATDAVTTAKIATGAVTPDELASDAVTTVKILDANVTTAKLEDDAVTSAKVASSASVDANRAITTDHIKDAAITSAKLGASTVTVDKLSTAQTNVLFFKDGSSFKECQIGGVLQLGAVSGASAPYTLEYAFNASSGGTLGVTHGQVGEQVASGTAAGAASAGAWTDRGITLTTLQGSTSFVTCSSNTFTIQEEGTYLITALIPFYSTGASRGLLYDHTATAALIYGTSVVAPVGGTAISRVQGSVTIAAANTYRLRYYTEYAVAGTGLGRPASTGQAELYAVVDIIKVA